MTISKYIQAVVSLIRLRSPTGWILLGLPGTWLLLKKPLPLSIWFLWWTGSFLARSTGCIINDWLDRDIDRHVKRTQSRPFANGTLGIKSFIILFATTGCMAITIAYALNPDVFLYSLLIAPWITLYPTAKRWLSVPQLFLAPVFAYSIIIANLIAPTPHVLVYYLGTCAWIIGYDTIYALSDLEDDLLLDIHSAPKTLGKHTLLSVAVCYALFALCITSQLALQNYLTKSIYALFIILLSRQVTRAHIDPPQSLFKKNIIIGALLSLIVMLETNALQCS